MKKRTIIALLTDFGTGDGYVAAMKGVILARATDVEIIDITHSIPPQNIQSAAYVLWSVYGFFPPGSIFVAVVDPGVGSSRPVCCTRANGYFFLHPGNGILDMVLAAARGARSVVLSHPRYRAEPVRNTFHGRDILAPAAAALAQGVPMRSLGTPRTVSCPKGILQPVSARRPGTLRGKVLHIDHFGNIVTNFQLKGVLPRAMSASLRSRTVREVHSHYAEAAPKRPFLLAGSSELIEIALRDASAAEVLHAEVNDSITLSIG